MFCCCLLKESKQTINNVELKVFDRVVVKISIDTKNVQHQKMKLELVQPKIEGFSVEPEGDKNETNVSGDKKKEESPNGPAKKIKKF